MNRFIVTLHIDLKDWSNENLRRLNDAIALAEGQVTLAAAVDAISWSFPHWCKRVGQLILEGGRSGVDLADLYGRGQTILTIKPALTE